MDNLTASVDLDKLLAFDFNAEVDREFPIPDNPHASVILRATENRAAMWRGINAARNILAQQGASHAANAGEADVQPGVDFAAKFIEKRAEDYARENSSMEHDTGATVWHYGAAGRDYHCTLIELAEDLRAAIASSAAQEGK
jgi:hypothetical protein